MSVHTIDPGSGLHVDPGHKGPKAYKVRWRDRSGAQHGATFDRKADADAFDQEKKRLRRGGRAAQVAAGITLDDWRSRRYSRDHRRNLAPGTRALYDRHWDRFISPYLGKLALADLTFDELADWQYDLLTELGLTVDQVHKTRTALGSVLTHAVTAQVLPGNQLHLVPRPKAPHTDEIDPLTPLEVEQIRAQLDDIRDQTIVSLLAYAGLRPGELRALKRSDRRARTLLVQRAANPDGTIKSTKTGHSRTVLLLGPLADDVDAYEHAHPGSRRGWLLDDVWEQHDWSNWRRRVWRPACEAAGMDPIPRPYDLRHSFASLLLAEGQPVLDVAKQLGHAARMTLDVYGHVIDEYAGLPSQLRPIAETEIRTAREQFPTRSQHLSAKEAA